MSSVSASALVPISSTVLPLTVTRPSAISFSAARREAMPAWDRIFCSRCSIPGSILSPVQGGTPMIRRVAMAFVILAVVLSVPAGLSAQLDPKAVLFTKPEHMKWVKNAAGTQETVTLFGDPNKEGEPYVIRLRWLPGNMSMPHSHPHDRFFVVISGTW